MITQMFYFAVEQGSGSYARGRSRSSLPRSPRTLFWPPVLRARPVVAAPRPSGPRAPNRSGRCSPTTSAAVRTTVERETLEKTGVLPGPLPDNPERSSSGRSWSLLVLESRHRRDHGGAAHATDRSFAEVRPADRPPVDRRGRKPDLLGRGRRVLPGQESKRAGFDWAYRRGLGNPSIKLPAGLELLAPALLGAALIPIVYATAAGRAVVQRSQSSAAPAGVDDYHRRADRRLPPTPMDQRALPEVGRRPRRRDGL